MSQHKQYIVGTIHTSYFHGGYSVYDFLNQAGRSFKLPTDFKNEMANKYGNLHLTRADDFINMVSEHLGWDVVSVSKNESYYIITFVKYIEDLKYL